MKQIGSQIQERIQETDYEIMRRPMPGDIILRDKVNDKYELWHVNNDFAGYTIKIGRWQYEFCRSFNGVGQGWSLDARRK